MTNEDKPFHNWFIVESANGKSKDGFPFGQVLCRKQADAFKVAKTCNQPIITKYKNENI